MLGLPYTYGLFETPEVNDDVKNLLNSQEFGGASVTIPHKLAIMSLLDELTPHAKAIGAVNTVIAQLKPDGSRSLLGDNTDWIGIRNTIQANLPLDAPRPKTGLVIGAGGTSRAALYALHSLGLDRIYLFNRTRNSAAKLSTALPDSYHIEVVDSLESFPGPAPSIIVSTVPGMATTTSKVSPNGLYIPSDIFKAEGGVVVDMAYRPAETPLLALAASVDGWNTVRGVDVLLEQGYQQFVAWTGRGCPKTVVAERVWEKYNSSS